LLNHAIDALTEKMASRYGENIKQEARQHFSSKLQFKMEQAAKEACEETWSEIVGEAKHILSELTQAQSSRCLSYESNTQPISEFDAELPEFDSLEEKLIEGRDNTSHMRLIGGETSQEQEIFAAYSMGMTPLEIAQHLQLKETEVRKALKGALSQAEVSSAWVAPQ
jgi:DNA-binding NarL/FixJ family response regulator